MKLRIALALLALGAGLAGVAQAQALKIALSSEPTSADPHYQQLTQNEALSAHIYGSLVARDANMKLIPGLALSWKHQDDTTWTFKLRPGVTFSNGKPFTSEDVLFTICRTLHNETNVSHAYTETTRQITDVQTPDPLTVIIKTDGPIPLLPAEFARSLPIIWNGIVPHGRLAFDPEAGCGVTGPWPTADDFNSGKAAIGTGPYILKSYAKGTGATLTRSKSYWGEKPYWKEVRLVPVPNPGPRLTGLLSGDFDLIENPASRDLQRIKSNPKFSYAATPSTRLIFFQPDIARSPSPQVKSPDGKNPLQDVRVRRAISMAIDRKAIVARLMGSMATVANQYLPDGMPGSLPHPAELKYDPEGARKLLAAAGYADGFELTISSTNDRYINDSQVAQAVAQYLSRIGIKANVDAMTTALYVPRRDKKEFSFSLGSWHAQNGEASDLFQSWVASPDAGGGLGKRNYGGFLSPEFDKIYLQAIDTMDAGPRAKLLRQATQIALDKMPLIPLHFESSVWAFRNGITYEGRRDQYTLAMSAKPAEN